jgi:competence protein ComEC
MKAKKLAPLWLSLLLLILFSSSGLASFLQVHFIDVGQGDSIFIETPKGKKILIDAGIHSQSNDPRNPFYYLKEKFKPDKTFEIDLAIITHPHQDHYGGLKYLCERQDESQPKFLIHGIYFTVDQPSSYKTFYPCLESLIKKSQAFGQIWARGPPPFKEEGLTFQILHPKDRIVTPNRNPNLDSAIILLSFKSVSFLFTGDAPKEVEKEIPDSLQTNVLKLGHHGSHTSSDLSFLKKVQPKDKIFYIVISANSQDGPAGRRYGHPHQETLETLQRLKNIKLYRTDIHGTIVFLTDGKIIQVEVSNPKEVSVDELWRPGR